MSRKTKQSDLILPLIIVFFCSIVFLSTLYGVGSGWNSFGRNLREEKKITSPLLEECHFPSRAWPQTHGRHTDKSRGCLTRLGKNVGRGSCRAAVTSPTPHFPLHVYSFPRRSPRGAGTLLSCVGLTCGLACGCRGAGHTGLWVLSVCLRAGGAGQRGCRGGFCHFTFQR